MEAPHDGGPGGTGQGLSNLPPEVLEYIFSFLSARDLARTSLACSQFGVIASENKLWRELYCHVFDISLQQCLPYIAPATNTSTSVPPPASAGSSDLPSQPINSSSSTPPVSSTSSDPSAPRESVVVISNVKLCFSDATHISVTRERDWRSLFALRYKVEKKHCISFLQRERELIKRRKLERSAARGKPHASEKAAESTMGDMEKEYWIDRTTKKHMTGIKRTMEALKYIAWGEILADNACDALDENDKDEALRLYMIACEEFHSGYSLLPANHSRMPDTVKDWAKALVKRMRLMKEKEQKALGSNGELEDNELSEDLQNQITQLCNKSNEIYESCLRISASNFDPAKRAELYWAYGNSLLGQAKRFISAKRHVILDPSKEQELVTRALEAFDKALEADLADGLEEYEVAYGVKNCAHSLLTYNNWRDRCLPSPAYDALIHSLWEECHKRLKRTLRADADLFAQKDRELGPSVPVKTASSTGEDAAMQTEGKADKKTEEANYVCDFDMDCHVEWASVVYNQAVRYNRSETIDKAMKGITLAKLILHYALEELDDDDNEWVNLVKGNLGLCHLRLAKFAKEQQAQEECYHLAELFFRESEGQNDDSLYNLASLYALRGRTAECEACLRSCLEANNLRAKELLEDEDLVVIRNEAWFPQLVEDAKKREEEQRKINQEEKRKKRKGIDEWGLTSDEEDEGDPDWAEALVQGNERDQGDGGDGHSDAPQPMDGA